MFRASWSRACARARSSKSPPTIGTWLMAATGGSRVAGPIAADGARILRDRQRLRQLLVTVLCELELVFRLVVLVGRRLFDLAVAVPIAVRGLLVGRDQLGQHPRERVHLVA